MPITLTLHHVQTNESGEVRITTKHQIDWESIDSALQVSCEEQFDCHHYHEIEVEF